MANRAREASHTELTDALVWIEIFESFCCALVFLGVALEALIAADNPPYGSRLERWGSTVANSFVAIGVLGELLSGIRVKLIQGELTRRSNDELADAKRAAGEANERAAEIERITAWRRVSSEQRAEITNSLLSADADVVLIIEYQRGDAEAHTFARDIMVSVMEANGKGCRITPNSHIEATFFGSSILLSSRLRQPDVIDAFESAGVVVTNVAIEHSPRGAVGDRTATMYCWVGPKLLAKPANAMVDKHAPKITT